MRVRFSGFPGRPVDLPFKLLLAMGVGGLVILAVVAVMWVGLYVAEGSTQSLLIGRARTMLDRVHGTLSAVLDPVLHNEAAMRTAAADGRIDLADMDRLELYLRGMVDGVPQIDGAAVLTPDGGFLRYPARTGGFVDDKVTKLPRGQADLSELLAAKEGLWGPPVPGTATGYVLINRRTPLEGPDGVTRAGLVQVVSVRGLSRLMTRGAADLDAVVPFILYGETRVLAHPLLIDGAMPEAIGGDPLPTLAMLGDGVLLALPDAKPLDLDVLEGLDLDEHKGAVDFAVRTADLGDREMIFLTRQVRGYADRPLTVGVVFDLAVFLDAYDQLALGGLAGLGILLLALAAALLLARILTRPAALLAEAAGVVGSGALDKVPSLPHSLFREFNQVSVAFGTMLDGLKEREQIRDLFGKYVPDEVARALLTADGRPQSLRTEATVVFVDIAGFTALAERLGPENVVEVLNAFFSMVTVEVERRYGTITQFQGDAVLAVFNVPVRDRGHAAAALQAGAAVLRQVRRSAFAGESLGVRIGIATGSVVAGSVGAADRLSYTVHGDAVNRAARLESLNKDFGLSLLVADQTVQAAIAAVQDMAAGGAAGGTGGGEGGADAADGPMRNRDPDLPALRPVGEISLRGQSRPVLVHTLATDVAEGRDGPDALPGY